MVSDVEFVLGSGRVWFCVFGDVSEGEVWLCDGWEFGDVGDVWWGLGILRYWWRWGIFVRLKVQLMNFAKFGAQLVTIWWSLSEKGEVINVWLGLLMVTVGTWKKFRIGKLNFIEKYIFGDVNSAIGCKALVSFVTWWISKENEFLGEKVKHAKTLRNYSHGLAYRAWNRESSCLG